MTITLVNYSIAVDEGVATVTFDRPGERMNTFDQEVFAELEQVLDRLEGDDEIHAVVLASGKPDNFIAGADINLFATLTDRTATEEMLRTVHALLDRVEHLSTERGKPVVAAIHGAALGGGLELALACSHRIASDDPKTQIGLPEVQLGVLPGWGGTQRLPALIGVANALDMILTGRPARPSKARRLGLVSEVVPRERLLDVAADRARAAVRPPEKEGAGLKSWLTPAGVQRAALEKNPLGRGVLFKQARQKTLAETKGNYPAPEKALEAVRIGLEEGREAGYAAEVRFFSELVVSPESQALRSIFFATRELKKDTGVESDVEARPVDRVAVLGGGLMGGGIAAVSSLKAGSVVRVKEVDRSGVERALQYVNKVVGGQVKRRRLGEFEAEQARLRVTGATDWSGFGDVDLVIEAVFEDLELKRNILQEVEGVVGPETVFASNTSTLPITQIAEASGRPETVLGMHYFSPVEKMPLLEVIVTPHTADWATATAVAYGKEQGKTVIVVNDGTGFYTSRVIIPYSNEAVRLLEEGASIEAVDSALTKWGFPVGPLLLADEVGLDVSQKVVKIMVDAFGDRMAGADFLDAIVESDRKGRKNRRGFYLYDDKGERGGPDESIYAELGLGPRSEVPASEIAERVSLMMVNEAARCLEEGILRSARDGDIGAVMGFGFPPFRGGPFWYVDELGAGEVVNRLERLAERHGDRFAPAGILTEAASRGTRFRA